MGTGTGGGGQMTHVGCTLESSCFLRILCSPGNSFVVNANDLSSVLQTDELSLGHGGHCQKALWLAAQGRELGVLASSPRSDPQTRQPVVCTPAAESTSPGPCLPSS